MSTNSRDIVVQKTFKLNIYLKKINFYGNNKLLKIGFNGKF